MRRCTKCLEHKPPTEFNKRTTRKAGYQSECRTCQHERYLSHYARDPAYYKAKAKRSLTSRLGVLYSYLAQHPCVDCGERDIQVLEFDHVRGHKLGNVTMLMRDKAMASAMAEVEKCEVVCANCHKRRTYARCDSLRTKFSGG